MYRSRRGAYKRKELSIKMSWLIKLTSLIRVPETGDSDGVMVADKN
jgi:hypothetical protein